MSQFSKDELSFVEELPEHVDIECPVCLNILSEPHQVTCCGHNFCKSCIERVKASNGACPMCKERRYQSFIDKKCLRIINGLQVYCTNKEKGCQWKGELKNLPTHLNKGKREGECQYQQGIECRYCRGIGQRRHLKPHEDNECLQRPVKCQYCYTKGTYHSITEEHYKKCSKYPVPCPNQCTLTRMPRGSVTGHVNNECPLQPVDCVFSWAGCKERPLRKDIELHTTDTKHMMILAVACGELKKENEKVKQEMATVRGELKKENEKVKQEMVSALKKENEKAKQEMASVHGELKKEIKELKDENKKLKQELRATSHHLLPIEIELITSSLESEVIYFKTSQQGYHMSAKLLCSGCLFVNTYTLLLAFHEGIFDKCKPSKLPKIFAKYEDEVIPLIEDTEAAYEFVHSDTLNEVTSTDAVPSGVLKKELGTVYFEVITIVNVRIYT